MTLWTGHCDAGADREEVEVEGDEATELGGATAAMVMS